MCASHDIVGEIKSMLKSGLKLLTGKKKKINERNNRPSALTSGRQQLVMVMVDL